MLKTESRKKIFLNDYQPPTYLTPKIDLIFDLDPDRTQVTGKFEVLRTTNDPSAPLVLDGKGQTVLYVAIDGVKLSKDQYSLTEDQLTIPRCPDRFELTIVNVLEPRKNKSLEGLYVSGKIISTQCEAQGFRRIIYSIDRPDNMASFRTTILANSEKYPHLLSNGNEVDSKILPDGHRKVVWEDPFKKPSYLFALVAGDLDVKKDQFITASGRSVELRIYVDKGRLDRVNHTLESLKKAMKWDEERFGLEYDLDLFMIVAVDDFNMGAMENKGLNIFNSTCALANPKTATDHRYELIDGIVAHEYFHNWTGNRVTCRDWFQLSLKEGLTVYRDQEYTADHYSRPVKRIDDVSLLRTRQFPEDAGTNAHPVRPEFCYSVDNFYTATIYEKGAEIIRMIETLVGREGFRKGIDQYFALYDGQAVTTDDFVHAMEIANNIDLTHFKRWYTQAGTPIIKITEDYDKEKQTYKLKLQQKTPPTNNQKEKLPLHIPFKFGLLNAQGEELTINAESSLDQPRIDQSTLLELTQDSQEFTFNGISERPVLSPLRDFSAPVNLDFSQSDQDLSLLMAHDSNAFNRWQAGQTLFTRYILSVYNNENEILSPTLIEALTKGFSSALVDPLFSSRLLSLPSTAELQQHIVDLDPIHLSQSINVAKEQIGRQFLSQLTEFYHTLTDDGEYSAMPQSIARRYLKSRCLSYLVASKNETTLSLAEKQFDQADNLTDQESALWSLNLIESPQKERVLEKFYQQWRHDPVVILTWFSAQSMADNSKAFEHLREALEAPEMSWENPNKVSSSIGRFAHFNAHGFHEESGRGYRLVAEKIATIDVFNSQVAAGIANNFALVTKLKPELRTTAQVILQELKDKNLSPGTYEIIENTVRALSGTSTTTASH